MLKLVRAIEFAAIRNNQLAEQWSKFSQPITKVKQTGDDFGFSMNPKKNPIRAITVKPSALVSSKLACSQINNESQRDMPEKDTWIRQVKGLK